MSADAVQTEPATRCRAKSVTPASTSVHPGRREILPRESAGQHPGCLQTERFNCDGIVGTIATAIARQLNISRASVYRLLKAGVWGHERESCGM